MAQTLLSADKVRAAEDLEVRVVDVPEWGGSVRLKQMCAKESAEFNDQMRLLEGGKNGIYLMLVFSAKDENDQRVFTLDDVEMLKGKSMDVLTRLQMIALEVNKMSVARILEIKNALGGTPTGASPSGSPATSAT